MTNFHLSMDNQINKNLHAQSVMCMSGKTGMAFPHPCTHPTKKLEYHSESIKHKQSVEKFNNAKIIELTISKKKTIPELWSEINSTAKLF